jgi:ribosomal protein S27AE
MMYHELVKSDRARIVAALAVDPRDLTTQNVIARVYSVWVYDVRPEVARSQIEAANFEIVHEHTGLTSSRFTITPIREDVTGALVTDKRCAQCGQSFVARRRDALTCGPTCRKARSRKTRRHDVAVDELVRIASQIAAEARAADGEVTIGSAKASLRALRIALDEALEALEARPK